jgi:hypothetical protein
VGGRSIPILVFSGDITGSGIILLYNLVSTAFVNGEVFEATDAIEAGELTTFLKGELFELAETGTGATGAGATGAGATFFLSKGNEANPSGNTNADFVPILPGSFLAFGEALAAFVTFTAFAAFGKSFATAFGDLTLRANVIPLTGLTGLGLAAGAAAEAAVEAAGAAVEAAGAAVGAAGFLKAVGDILLLLKSQSLGLY